MKKSFRNLLVSRLICGFTVPPPDQAEARWGLSEFLLERNVKDTTLGPKMVEWHEESGGAALAVILP
jgi:hypothetical protein